MGINMYTNLHSDLDLNIKTFFNIIWKYKLLIVGITILITFITVLAIWKKKPVYTGNALIEIGYLIGQQKLNDSVNANMVIKLEDNLNDLKEITTKITGVTITVPAGSTNLIILSTENSNINLIKPKIQKATNFIINRHLNKASLYSKYNYPQHMTQMIGEIDINTQPISVNKWSVIFTAFSSTFFLSIFLAFALEFFQRNRKPRD